MAAYTDWAPQQYQEGEQPVAQSAGTGQASGDQLPADNGNATSGFTYDATSGECCIDISQQGSSQQSWRYHKQHSGFK
jgi:hypothetical protein